MKNNNSKIIIVIIVALSILTIGIGVFIQKYYPIPNQHKDNYSEILCKTEEINYKVKENETTYDIGVKFNLMEQYLLSYNKINDTDIKVGTELKIPNITKYSLKKEDTISSLSNKFLITPSIIKKANDLTSDNLDKLKEIIIPNTKVHCVKENETLEQIANKYNVTVEELKKRNSNMNDPLIKDEILIIPTNIGTYKQKDDVIISNLDVDSQMELIKIGNKIIDNKDFGFGKNNNGIYTFTLEQLNNKGYNAKDYTIGCKSESEIIKIDTNKLNQQQDYTNALSVYYRCN